MRPIPHNIGTLHFIGIGGIGMSGIAEVLNALGYDVQGSDMSESPNVERLREKGMTVFIGHEAKNIEGAAVVVVSSAIKADNPELLAAREKRIPVVRRAEMLAELMRLKWSIAIGGTHGKTTTTTMVGAMLEEGGFDPTVINGGIVNKYGTNTRLGESEWMVVEADESDGTFTRLPATVAVVTNIDPEHMDHYGSFDSLRGAFYQFIENLPFYGFAVLCTDHEEVQALIPKLTDKRVITYGFNPQADVRVSNLRSRKDGSEFDVTFAAWMCAGKEETLRDVFLPMPGQHNVLNSCAALAIAHEMGTPAASMKNALAGFSGVKRRFTKTGEVNGITVIDDYGHHPVEIKAVLKAARQAVSSDCHSGENPPSRHPGEGRDLSRQGKIIAVMQPHRYSRLHDLFDEFATCFNDADHVFIADVYAAGEKPIEGATKEALTAAVKQRGHKSAHVLGGPDTLAEQVAEIAKPEDFIICLGAGDITKWAYALPAQLEKILESKGEKRA